LILVPSYQDGVKKHWHQGKGWMAGLRIEAKTMGKSFLK